MVKYKIVLGNQTIEFGTEAEALQYKTDNNLSEEVESFEDDITDQLHVPESVTPRQFRQALVLSNVSIQMIEDLINSQPEPMKSLAMIEWEYSTVFIRSNQMVNQLAPALEFTPSMLDDLWILAETL
jgi:hypothetical protein